MNIANLLQVNSELYPNKNAVTALRSNFFTKKKYVSLTFKELEDTALYYAYGMIQKGVKKSDKVLVFIRPGLDFPAITFALFKIGAVPVFIDPGMGRKNLLRSIETIRPRVLIAVPIVFLIKSFYKKTFSSIEISISSWGFKALKNLGKKSDINLVDHVKEDDLAAILFTSGGTGIPKGVEYSHQIFSSQTRILKEIFSLTPEDIDMPGFPLFALFTIAMGMTSCIPNMNPSRPAKACPKKLIKNILDTNPTFVAGSPAIWEKVALYCNKHFITLPSVKYLVMFGAPIPLDLHILFKKVLTNGTTYTPYGATESLPVSCISAKEILSTHKESFLNGKGTCVGKPAPSMQVKIIKLYDKIFENIKETTECGPNEMGEIIVKGETVTKRYFSMPEKTKESKIYEDDGSFWHRIGDMGYLDTEGNLWFAGRKNYRVQTKGPVLSSIQCEAIFNQHPLIKKSALIGTGHSQNQNPEVVLETFDNKIPTGSEREGLLKDLTILGKKFAHTQNINKFHFIKSMPVDIRHNIKIDRKQLKDLAEKGELL